MRLRESLEIPASSNTAGLFHWDPISLGPRVPVSLEPCVIATQYRQDSVDLYTWTEGVVTFPFCGPFDAPIVGLGRGADRLSSPFATS